MFPTQLLVLYVLVFAPSRYFLSVPFILYIKLLLVFVVVFFNVTLYSLFYCIINACNLSKF